jgi:hypothetical protein
MKKLVSVKSHIKALQHQVEEHVDLQARPRVYYQILNKVRPRIDFKTAEFLWTEFSSPIYIQLRDQIRTKPSLLEGLKGFMSKIIRAYIGRERNYEL